MTLHELPPEYVYCSLCLKFGIGYTLLYNAIAIHLCTIESIKPINHTRVHMYILFIYVAAYGAIVQTYDWIHKIKLFRYVHHTYHEPPPDYLCNSTC